MPEFERQRSNGLPPSGPTSGQHSESNSEMNKSSAVAAGPARLLNQLAEAIREFDEPTQVTADPQVAALMKHAHVLHRAGETRLAYNILRGVLMRQPDHAEALEMMGRAHRDDGRFEEALKCFRALAKATRTIDAQILIAESLYMSERDTMALAAYREILKRAVTDTQKLFDIYKNVGNINVRNGDFDAAEEFYNKAYSLKSDSDALMVNYGTLEIQRENLGEAVERFRQAVAINASNDKAWVGLAIVHRQMGDLDLAWGNVLRALDINRANRTAIRLAVDWSVQDHRLALAVERLQDYLAIEGEDVEMSFTLAKILTHLGHLPEARMEMERVLALDPAIEGAEAVTRALDQELARKAKATAEAV